ncbi:hypothetical protein Dfri01_59090 [Dyadobacter frigoris]|nr:hypothetical protein Dfri01_59090 [Dyadobacter frigoris]
MDFQFTNTDGSVTKFPNTHGLFYSLKNDPKVWMPFTGQEEVFNRGNIRVEYIIKDTCFSETSKVFLNN